MKMTEKERKEYCKDCERSIYAETPSCDVNIEDNGYYNLADNECKCKVIATKPERVDVFKLNKMADERGIYSSRKSHHVKKWQHYDIND